MLGVSVLDLPNIPLYWHQHALIYLQAHSEAAEVRNHPEKYGRRA